MEVKISSLFATNEYRRDLIKLGVLQLIPVLILLVSLCLISGVLNSRLDNLCYSAAGRLYLSSPEAAADFAGILLRGGNAADLEAGREFLGHYGYDDNLKMGMKAFFADMPVFIAGLSAAALLSSLIVNFHLFHRREKSFYKKAGVISKKTIEIIDGDFSKLGHQWTRGLWAELLFNFNRMTDKIRISTEKLSVEKNFLGNILSDISHQLKTPIAALRLFNDLMLDEPGMESDKRRSFLSQSSSQLDRMTWLVKSLLQLAKLEAGEIVYKISDFPAEAFLKSAWTLQNESSGNRIFRVIDKTGGSGLIRGDRNWLSEAFGNLLKNAIEHTGDSGSITAVIERTPLFLRISLTDDGDGISEEDLPRIFTRFFSGTSSVNMESVGIGLPLSRMIIEGNNGNIRAVPDRRSGAEFIISFMTYL